jgi:hypothetical protein
MLIVCEQPEDAARDEALRDHVDRRATHAWLLLILQFVTVRKPERSVSLSTSFREFPALFLCIVLMCGVHDAEIIDLLSIRKAPLIDVQP